MNTTVVLQNLATWVLWNSSGAAVLVLLILAVRLIAGRAMSARLRSRLWLLVVVRLMLPLLPAVSLPSRVVAQASSFMARGYARPIALEAIQAAAPAQAVEPTPGRSAQVEVDSAPQFVVVEEGMMPPSATPTATGLSATAPLVIAEAPPAPKSAPINWLRILLITWLAGTSALFARIVVTTIRLQRLTRRFDIITDPKIVELLASCCDQFNVKQIPQLLAGGEGSAPALIGVIHPKIVLPAKLASQLSLDEIRLIFLHELAHLRRRDVLLNYLFAILTALHWFNPLLWIASWRMAADRELACDEAVLRVTSRRHARMYGCTILRLIELLDIQRLPAGAVGVVQNKTLIQRRIDMIASYPSRTPRSSLFVRCAAMSLALAAAVSAIRAQEAPAPVPPTPAAPSALPAPAPSPTPAEKPESAPSALPPAPIGIAPSAASKPPAAGIAHGEFTAEEIEPVNAKVQVLEQNVNNARLAVDALKNQGLESKNKSLIIAEDALASRERELRDYVASWNQRYTILISPDGTPHAVRKGSNAPLAAIASGAAPAAVGMAPVAASAPPGALPPAADPAAPVPGVAPLPPSGDDVSALRGRYLVDPLAPQRPMQPNAIPPGAGSGGGGFAGSGAPGGVRAGGMGGGGVMGGFGVARPGSTTTSVEDGAAREANAEVMQKLAKSHAADFHGSVLREALSYIADGSGVDVVIDERALSQVGVDVNAEQVTLHTGSKPMEQILSLTLRLASPQLDYSIYNGVVFVSSRDALNRRIVTRIYDIPSSVDRDAMLQTIVAAVGNARCNFFDQKIVVTAPEVAQRDVARLLAQIGPVPSPGAPKAMLMFKLRNAKASEVAAKFPKELGSAAADDRTNSVLITTPQLDAAKDFVAKLDGGQPSNVAHSESVTTSVNSQEAQLADALSMYKAMYGSDNPHVKLLEKEISAMRLQAASKAPEESSIGR